MFAKGEIFTINGRFLCQSVTGVQRYARMICTAMNDQLSEAGGVARVIAPRGAIDPLWACAPLRTYGPVGGHVWEQAILPIHAQGRLLNLCNTAPVLKGEQIVCLHDASVFVAPSSFSPAFRALYTRLQPAIVKGAARIVTVSEASARQIARFLPVRQRDIAIIPNGAEHALAWDPSQARGARTFMGRQERGFVFALGSRARHKNLSLLTRIAPALDELGLDLVIAGQGGRIFSTESIKSRDTIKVLENASDHDIALLMERALCLAFPSWTEGFGLPIVEAMTRGCPVISSDRASMPEVCGAAALFAAPDSPRAWVEAIARLKTDRALRDDLIARGYENVQRFSWATGARDYLALAKDTAHVATYRGHAARAPKIGLVIATYGRPEIVSATIDHLMMHQTLKPSALILSCAERAHAGSAATRSDVTLVLGPVGLTRQRNAGLAALAADIDVVVFFDDDFIADPDWLAVAAHTFADMPDVVGFTGAVLADGVKGPGLSFESAAAIVANTSGSSIRRVWNEPFSPYGCNMAFRMAALKQRRFDERLVLYGWLEDRDFGGGLAQSGGRIVKSAAARGVHMGVKGGRVAGDRLGYSQIVNPLYLLRKGTMTPWQVVDHVARNVLSNLAGSLRPEPFVDRRGRLRGNLLALCDVLRGRLDPERAAQL